MAVIFGCIFVVVAVLTGYTIAGGKVAAAAQASLPVTLLSKV